MVYGLMDADIIRFAGNMQSVFQQSNFTQISAPVHPKKPQYQYVFVYFDIKIITFHLNRTSGQGLEKTSIIQ